VTAILLIRVSPRPSSFSRLIATEVAERLRQQHPGARVIDRDLAAAPPPHPDAAFYEAILSRSDAPNPVLDYSERLIVELEQADAVVIGTPMNNFTVPSTLKAWLDHIVRIRRTFASTPEGKKGLLRDRPVIVVTASGGYVDQPPGQPDFLTPYLRAILGCIGLTRLEFIKLEGLARGPEVVERALAQARSAIAQAGWARSQATTSAAFRSGGKTG
jgi:FMN-dependent NADH-azoreductase